MLRIKYVLLTIMLFPFVLHAQVSNNMSLLDQWNPSVPQAGSIKFNDIWGYVDDNGREYAILGSAAFIHIVDVTDPTNVVEVDRIEAGQSTVWRDFKVFQDRIYAVSDNTSEGLIIMDASFLPDSVHVTYQSNEYFDMCHNIFIDEAHGRLYVAGANSQNNGLIVLDLTQDPDNPSLLTTDVLAGSYIHDLYVNDNIVYASHGWNGLYIYDYTDLDSIRNLANIGTNGYNHSSWLTEDFKYLIYAEEIPSGVDMGVIDVTGLYNGDIEIIHLFKFPLLAPVHTNVTPHNPYIRDTMLVVSYYDDGTQVFDIGDPTDARPFAYYDTYSNSSYSARGNWGTYPFLPSGNIISSDTRNGLFVMSMDNYDFTTIDYEPTFEEVAIEVAPFEDICSEDPIMLEASGNYPYYRWYRDGQLIPNQNSNSFLVSESGTYEAIGFQGQYPIQSAEFVFEKVVKPTLAIQGNTLEALPNTGTYDWFINGKSIGSTSINSATIHPKFSGYFQAERTVNGCPIISDSTYFFAPRALNIEQIDGLHARYLFDENSILLSIESNGSIELNLNVYNIAGQSLYRSKISANGFDQYLIPSESWVTGIYFVTVDNGSYQDSYKLYIP